MTHHCNIEKNEFLQCQEFIPDIVAYRMKREGKMHKRRIRIHLNIGTLIFGFLFVYLIVIIILSVTKKKVETYQVISGTLSGNDTYTALILRNEDVVKSDSDGYVTYFVNGSAKVSKSDAVCVVSSEQNALASKSLDSSDYQKLRKIAANASKSFNSLQFDTIYDLQYSIGSVLWDTDDAESISGNLYQASTDGLVSTYVDGMEYLTQDELTADLGQNSAYSGKRLKNQEEVSDGTDLYRIVNGEEWYIYFPLTDEQTLKLAALSSVKVKFLSDNNTEKGDISFFTNGDQRFAKITLSNGLYRYVNDRYVDVEIVCNDDTGLKIPTSAIVTKEFYVIPESFLTYSGDDETGFLKEVKKNDGSSSTEFVETTVYAKVSQDDGEDLYYVEKSAFNEGDVLIQPDSDTSYTIGECASLDGVYCVNRGYSVFRKIQIIDKDSDFCIVEEGTSYGISLYDYIVKDGSSVKENEIIN